MEEYIIGFIIILLTLSILPLLYFIMNRSPRNTEESEHIESSSYYSPPQNTHYHSEYNSRYDYSYMPYRKAKLLTKTEYAFFVTLVRESLKRQLLVCPKVRLEDIAYVTTRQNRNKYRGYIKSRHIDFVLINAQSETIAAIELDDPSHDTAAAAQTDHFKNELFKTIGVPLIRIRVGTDYRTQINVAFDNLNIKIQEIKRPAQATAPGTGASMPVKKETP